MELNDAIRLADKLAAREHTVTELKAVVQFLRAAKRSDAEAFMTRYYNALPMKMDGANVDPELMDRLLQLDVDRLDDIERALPNVHRVHFLKTAWLRYAAAIIVLLSVGTYLYINNQKEKPSVTQTNPLPVENDVKPGGNRATLTLADGNKIILDSAPNGKLAEQGKTIIEKKDNQIVYSTSVVSRLSSLVSFNTMATPRGGQFQLQLPDGSEVWLNAASSITYPTAFNGKTREVSITGEVYFEVTKNKRQPFIVKAGEQSIEVLGTHFNVNAYKDEELIKTTLLEGSVRLTPHASRLTNVNTSLTLKPGQQGQLTARGLFLAANPNLEQVMAWKNGAFYFKDTELDVVMRQFSRWYDVEVVYPKEKVNKKISGDIGRDLNLSEVLEGLKGLGVQTRIEGKKLFVTVR